MYESSAHLLEPYAALPDAVSWEKNWFFNFEVYKMTKNKQDPAMG